MRKTRQWEKWLVKEKGKSSTKRNNSIQTTGAFSGIKSASDTPLVAEAFSQNNKRTVAAWPLGVNIFRKTGF